MAIYTSTAGAAALLPTDVGRLVVQPVQDASTALQTTTVVRTSSHDYRIPIVEDDPNAAWLSEGDEITPSDATFDEITVTPAKVGGLSIISREMADDSDPSAAQAIGLGLARDIARKIDQAFFTTVAAPAPDGINDVSGYQTAVGAYTDLDPFAEAISLAEQVGATLSCFVTDPATALTLSTLREATGSNKMLLGSDATVAGQRRILGVPLLTNPSVATGVVWAYDRSKVWSVVREDVRLEVDRSVYFTSDRVAVKATMRVGFAFPHPASIVKITAA